ncbi:hypothetical protein WA588_002316 [Blastocystis sp. NMH]
MSESTPKPKLSLLFNKKRAQGEKKPEETENAQPPATTSFGTRKHPVKVTVPKRKQSTGLTNPLQLLTNKNMFAASTFSDMNLNEKIVEVLTKPNVFGFSQPTIVQSYAIPEIMKGGDVMIKSETGSGKTLAYLIPIVQMLQASPQRIERSDGAYCVILVPTRELCVQIEEAVKKLLLPFFWIVPTVICGGQKRKAEKSRLRKGANIIISTPGRLLDHALHTASLSLSRVRMLVLDEADRLLDMGFEQQLRDLLALLRKQAPRRPQTVLLSATLSPALEQLATLSLQEPSFLDVDKLRREKEGDDEKKEESNENDKKKETETEATFQVPKQLRQYFVQVESNLRLPTLCAFLRKELRAVNSNHCRILVFVNTCDSVAFHDELLRELAWPGDGIDATAYKGTLVSLHGNMPQHQRLKHLRDFCKANYATMLCTDVAARGLDIPTVDWIVQYDPPTEISEYIHRVGRTARAGKSGQSVLFLQPSEMGMLYTLESRGLSLKQFNFDVWFDNCVRESGPGNRLIYAKRNHAASEIQASILKTVEESDGLKDLAIVGFTSYCRAYTTYSKELKTAFNVRSLHFGHVARSFGLRETPKKLGRKAMAKSKRHALEMASAVGEGSAKLDFGHTSEKKQRMFDMIKKEKEIRKSREEKREKKKASQGDFLKGKKKVEKLMSVREWD